MGGTVPGMYTTVEGILSYYLRRLEDNPMADEPGDSRSMDTYQKFQQLMNTLKEVSARRCPTLPTCAT